MNKKGIYRITLAALLVAAAAMGFGFGVSLAAKAEAAAPAAGTAIATPMIPAGFSDLAEKVRTGVVNIQTVRKVEGPRLPPDNPFGDFFGPFSPFGPFGGRNTPERRQQGVGSGFIISKDGYIVTNNHVVEGADQIRVKLSDGKEREGKVVGRDPRTDLALVKIDDPSDLQPLILGDSDSLRVGEWVVAVGSPFGLEQTVTAGIVSAKGRLIGSGPYDDFIQTDASINPGNSGGPLINLRGEVVGINTAIIASGQGIGFAIPVNMAKEIAPQLQARGHVTRGMLGVGIQDVTPDLARSFGMKEAKGALVSQITPGGPADKGGIQQGDVIVAFDGKNVADSRDLPRIVAATPVGKTVTVKVLRNGKELDRTVTVAELEEEAKETAKTEAQKNIGLTVQTMTPQLARQFGVKPDDGVVVTSVVPNSPAAEAGLRVGDLIREVDRQAVKNTGDFQQRLAQAKDTVLLLIQRSDGALFVAVKLK
ncbi:MAG: DegQ family serine endoprotease [Syntrophaceae bacterium]|nr:DegQ family serine endoprotease [Syntrophaceae bacterium]